MVDPNDIVLDVQTHILYWVDIGLKGIYSSNTDGSDFTKLNIMYLQNPYALGFDIENKMLFWTDLDLKTINSYKLETNESSIILKGIERATAVATDPINHKLYWIDLSLVGIFRADYDGNNIEQMTVSEEMGNFHSGLVVLNIK